MLVMKTNANDPSVVKLSTAVVLSHAHDSNVLTLHAPLRFDADVSITTGTLMPVVVLKGGTSGDVTALYFKDVGGAGVTLAKPFGSRQLHLLGGARLHATDGTDVVAACTATPGWALAATSWPAGTVTSSAQSAVLKFGSSPSGSAKVIFEDADGASGRSEAVALYFDGATIRVLGGGLIVGGVDVRSVCTSV